MSSRIETEHAGHTISYSENEDVWRCYTLDLEAKTLSLLRQKINTWLNKTRKLGSGVEVWYFSNNWDHKPERVKATSLTDDGQVWLALNEKGRYARTRTKVPLDKIVMITDENRKLIGEMQKTYVLKEQAKAAFDAAFEAIPRATLASLGLAKEKDA